MQVLKWVLYLIAAIAIVTALGMAAFIILAIGLVAGALINVFALVSLVATSLKAATSDKDST